MAYLRLSANDGTGETYLRVAVDGLQYPASDYDSIVIYNDTTGQAYSAGGGGGSTGSYFTNAQTFGGLSGGVTYNFYAEAQKDATGSVVRIPSSGYYSFATIKPRPSNFSWSYSKIQGADCRIYAFEWNNLTSKVNEFRNYKGYSSLSFTSAYSGMDIYAYMFNQVVNGISSMSPSISPPSTKYSGSPIAASDLNLLVYSLNSV